MKKWPIMGKYLQTIYKELIFKICKNACNSLTKNNSIIKWAKDVNMYFPKKVYEWPTSTWKGA